MKYLKKIGEIKVNQKHLKMPLIIYCQYLQSTR